MTDQTTAQTPTPRTDARLKTLHRQLLINSDNWIETEFAKSLERELASANDRAAQAEKERDKYRDGIHRALECDGSVAGENPFSILTCLILIAGDGHE